MAAEIRHDTHKQWMLTLEAVTTHHGEKEEVCSQLAQKKSRSGIETAAAFFHRQNGFSMFLPNRKVGPTEKRMLFCEPFNKSVNKPTRTKSI